MKYALLALLLVGCSGASVTSFPPTDTVVGGPDASSDSADVVNPTSLCCTGPTNPVWGNVWQCDADGGAPWICGEDDGGVVFACDDPRCGVDSWCQGITGYGTVSLCPDE